MARTREQRDRVDAWMLEHPYLWRGLDLNDRTACRRLFRRMQLDGVYSDNSRIEGVNWQGLARRAQKAHEHRQDEKKREKYRKRREREVMREFKQRRRFA